MESLKERVRAKPAWDATVSSGFGAFSWALGLAEVFTPHALLGWMGVDKRMAPLVRAYGMREIGAGVAILQNPIGPQFLWSRVAGDALDLATLFFALKGRSRRPDRVTIALGVVAAITVADLLMSARLSQLSASKRLERAS